jgi:branched-chain amino acid transport system permease protein
MTILGISWDVLSRTGQTSFGQSAYFGISVYAIAIFSKSMNIVLAWILSIILAMLIAALMGALLFRLKGRYFTISTMAFSLALQVIAILLPFTGAPADHLQSHVPRG